jgi:LuxR family maltose regulon positive regulatory protein
MEEELFASVPVSLQRFLVILSLFDEWPLDAMEKIADALPEKLPPMEEFTESMRHLSSLIYYDTYLHGFRIHRVFLDFLREKQKEVPGEEIKTACSIKAGWCLENNLRTEAIIYYGMASNYEGLARAIYSFPRLLSQPVAADIMEILDRVLNDPMRNEDDENFLFLRHVTRPGILVILGRFDESRVLLYKSIEEIDALPPSPFSSRILSSCYNTLGVMVFMRYRVTGNINAAPEYFERGDYYYKRHPYPVSGSQTRASIGSYMNTTEHSVNSEEFENFAGVLEKCIYYASNSMGGYISGADSLCRTEMSFFKGDINTAEQHGLKAAAKAHEKGQYEIESKSLFYLLRVYLCNGNIPAGMETRKQLEAQLDISDYINRYVMHDIITGWFYAHIGETDQIAPWLRNEFEESDLNLLHHNFETMVKAKCLFAEKRWEDALKFLERRDVREGLGSFYLGMLEISVLEAAVRLRMGDSSGALKALETAYKMSLSEALDMPFIELGEDMRLLAALALEGGKKCAIKRSWLENIRKKASVYGKKLTLEAESRRNGHGDENIPFLSSQELSILTEISRGFTIEKIAVESSLSKNTVKSIIKAIYAKLGALNRASAIRIATKAGILKN